MKKIFISKHLTDKYYLLFIGVTTWLSYLWLHNHRMAEVGREHWRSSGPTLLLKQGHPQLVAQEYVWIGFWVSPRRETPQPPWQPVLQTMLC